MGAAIAIALADAKVNVHLIGRRLVGNSSSGLIAKPNSAPYDATKHALKAIAGRLRGEVNAHGVRVLSVYLGRTASRCRNEFTGPRASPTGRNYYYSLKMWPL